jgi:hypothetical protein
MRTWPPSAAWSGRWKQTRTCCVWVHASPLTPHGSYCLSALLALGVSYVNELDRPKALRNLQVRGVPV